MHLVHLWRCTQEFSQVESDFTRWNSIGSFKIMELDASTILTTQLKFFKRPTEPCVQMMNCVHNYILAFHIICWLWNLGTLLKFHSIKRCVCHCFSCQNSRTSYTKAFAVLGWMLTVDFVLTSNYSILIFTCKRGSTELSDKDDFEHAVFKFQANQNLSTDTHTHTY